MKKQNRKLPRTARRGLALALASALALSVSAPGSFAWAAKQTKPLLSAKKKTLYYDKAGKKAFTLKVKKNKVKMIVATKWKTSKKKIVALSKQKDMSVKLTAKKKGTSTITGTIKYVPKGKWAIKTVKLTCKVTSKSIKAAAKPTEPPTQAPAVPPLQSGNPGGGRTEPTTAPGFETPGATEGPMASESPGESAGPDVTAGPETSVEPTAEPGASEGPMASEIPGESAGPDASSEPGESAEPSDPDVASISVDPSVAILSTARGRDSVSLKAVVTAKDGSEVEDAAVTWVSDDEDVAEVDEEGTVKAVGGGTANITASAGGLTSEPCVVTVDDQAPSVEKADVSDYKTFVVTFTEPVTGTPEILVTSDEGKRCEQTAELAEDGKTMTISCKEALGSGSYEIQINGLTDLAGNQMEEDTVASAVKESSVLEKFVCRNEKVPAGQSSFDVLYAAVDQYGQEFENLPILAEGTLTVSAETENGMPFKSELKREEGRITVTGPASAFVEGRKIKITMTYSVEGKKEVESVLVVTVVDAANKGKPAEFVGMELVSETMTKVEGTENETKFRLSGNSKEDTFRISSILVDEFGYPANPSDIIYMIEDESILTFTNSREPNTGGINTSDDKVEVRALKGGSTTIHAYLAADDSKHFEMKVEIWSTKLEGIVVGPIDEGINGRTSEAKITLVPEGSGITADQLKCVVSGQGSDRVNMDSFKCWDEEDGIYVRITAKSDGKDDPIKFKVVYDTGTGSVIESNEVTYRSVPLDTPASIKIDSFDKDDVIANEKAVTQYHIYNRYGEEITNREGVNQPICQIKDSNVISGAVVGTGANAGTLTVQAGNPGTTQIDLYMANNREISATMDVTVARAAFVKEIQFGKLTDKENGLPLGDMEKVLYIPITALNQYGKDFKSLTKATAASEIRFTVNGTSYDPAESFLTIDWYKKTGANTYAPAGERDVTDTIAVRWNPDNECTLGQGQMIKIGAESRDHADEFVKRVFEIPVQASRRLAKLTFKEDYKAAVDGAQVTNTIELFDQHEDKYTLPDGATIEVVVKYGDKSQTLGPEAVQEENGIVKCVMQVDQSQNQKEYGIYTVQASVKDALGNPVKDTMDKPIIGSYLLRVDSAQELIKKLEISDTATISGEGEPVKLTGKCMDLRNEKTVQFDYKAFTTYNGRDVEICLKDGDGNLVSSNNLPSALKWKVSGTNVTAVERDGFGVWKIGVGKSATKVKVDLGYFTTDLHAPSLEFDASGADPEPKGLHQIVTYDEDTGEYGTEDLKNGTFRAEKDPNGYRFALRDVDQYGNSCPGAALYTVATTNDDAVGVVIGKDGGFAGNEFKVTLKESAKVGETYTIRVYVDEKLAYSFAVIVEATSVQGVTMVPETMELTLDPGKKTGMLGVEFQPAYASNQKVEWSSSNSEIVDVDGGKVTARKNGTAVITATTVDGGKTATCTVIVGNGSEVPVESATPVASGKPAASANPATSANPAVSAKPVASVKPAASAKPDVNVKATLFASTVEVENTTTARATVKVGIEDKSTDYSYVWKQASENGGEVVITNGDTDTATLAGKTAGTVKITVTATPKAGGNAITSEAVMLNVT